ncbi:MAG: TetR/AcrR family transcriptional regulator, partial [Candidatus Izemoplasmatales bacterium]|nr:TetR/AcrR family transcriptional regulator [Candidatus Izemoplasmatales bacterium]
MKYLDKTQLLLENEELFQATLGEFAENNYKQASTNEIIKKSKINRGSFYYRFNNKEELFIALIDHIFVEQIALFNKRKINLLTEKSLENIIFELFYNLYELYNFDNNYYKVIINHLQDSDSLLLIDKSTIEPLKHRIFKVLEQFTNIDKFEYIKIIINSVYHQFPKFLLNSYNVEDELKSFVNFILSTDEKKNILDNHTNINLKDIAFNDEITYFLSPVKNINVNDRYTSINDAFVNYKATNKSLFSLVGISILSFKSTVLKLVRKSLKDVRYLLEFLNLEILEYLKKNYIFKRLLMTSLLFTVKEEPNISINLSEIPLNEKEKHLFLSLILPIISKTSKIL